MIDGVVPLSLTANPDDRGDLTEVWRVGWDLLPDLLQWNLVRSNGGVMRGVHVHPRHDEVVIVPSGHLRLGVHDLRPDSPTFHQSAIFEVEGDTPGAVVIPRGVAHGFLTVVPTSILIGMTSEYDPTDDIGMRWDDPALGFDWQCEDPLLSERDAGSPSMQTVIDQLAAVSLSAS